jgi:Domain of unknown function (DUF4345)
MRTTQTVPLWIREIVLINAAVFLAFGLAFILFPVQLASLIDIAPSSASALADLRAMYGGLSLSAGVFFLLGLRRESWFLPSLFLVMASSACLALARLYSIAVSGVPGALVLAFLASELGSFAWAWLGYRALTANDAERLVPLPGSSSGV